MDFPRTNKNEIKRCDRKMTECIFKDWIRVLDKHTGKRFASVYKEND